MLRDQAGGLRGLEGRYLPDDGWGPELQEGWASSSRKDPCLNTHPTSLPLIFFFVIEM